MEVLLHEFSKDYRGYLFVVLDVKKSIRSVKASRILSLKRVISLGLGDKETKLEAIFQRNYQPEMFKDENALFCERCQKKCDASKRTRIIQAPQTLIVTLKRFEYDPTIENIRKIDREIEYKEELSLPLQVSEVAVKVELFAVIVA